MEQMEIMNKKSDEQGEQSIKNQPIKKKNVN